MLHRMHRRAQEVGVMEVSRLCLRGRLMGASPGLAQECTQALPPASWCHLSSVPRERWQMVLWLPLSPLFGISVPPENNIVSVSPRMHGSVCMYLEPPFIINVHWYSLFVYYQSIVWHWLDLHQTSFISANLHSRQTVSSQIRSLSVKSILSWPLTSKRCAVKRKAWNLQTNIAGFFLASQFWVEWISFVWSSFQIHWLMRKFQGAWIQI